MDIWDPLSLSATVDLLNKLSVPWWIAGGYAIDLFVEKNIRPHGDIDVVVCRCHQLEVQSYLSGWDLNVAVDGELRSWCTGELLEGKCKDIWCRKTLGEPWALQLMLIDTENNDWVFRRDPTIRGSLTTIGRCSSAGVPYLSPEIQLLYKVKQETIEKDQVDFDAAVPLFGLSEQKWLKDKINKLFPEGHQWAESIETMIELSRHNRLL